MIAGQWRVIGGAPVGEGADFHGIVNLFDRKAHVYQRGTKTGGIEHVEASIHISNVALVCKKCGKPTRVGYEIDGDGDIITGSATNRDGGMIARTNEVAAAHGVNVYTKGA